MYALRGGNVSRSRSLSLTLPLGQVLELYGAYFLEHALQSGYGQLLRCVPLLHPGTRAEKPAFPLLFPADARPRSALGDNSAPGDVHQNNYVYLLILFSQCKPSASTSTTCTCCSATASKPCEAVRRMSKWSTFTYPFAAAFRVSDVTSSSLLLHYTTSRPGMGLHFLSKGILTAVGPTLFGRSTAVEIIDCSDGGEATLSVSFPRITEVAPKPLGLCLVGLNPIQFADLHPFHMLLDSRCRVLQGAMENASWLVDRSHSSRAGWVTVGAILTRLFATTLLPESHVMDTFRLAHPYLPEETLQSSAALHTHIASSLVFASIASGLRLKGQMLPVELEGGAPALLFLLTPMLHSLGDADRHGIFLSDSAFPPVTCAARCHARCCTIRGGSCHACRF